MEQFQVILEPDFQHFEDESGKVVEHRISFNVVNKNIQDPLLVISKMTSMFEGFLDLAVAHYKNDDNRQTIVSIVENLFISILLKDSFQLNKSHLPNSVLMQYVHMCHKAKLFDRIDVNEFHISIQTDKNKTMIGMMTMNKSFKQTMVDDIMILEHPEEIKLPPLDQLIGMNIET